MSELLLTPFGDESSKLVNGLSKGTQVFIYDLISEPSLRFDTITPYFNLQNYNVIGASIPMENVQSNYLYIKREMGMMDVENSIQQTIDFKYSTKKVD